MAELQTSGRRVSLTNNPGKYFIHVAIVLFFMFGFKLIPPIEPITQVGMGVLGVFLGVIWGWTFCSQAWPSVLSLIAIGFTGYTTVSGALVSGFGHSNVILIMFTLPLMRLLDHAGITRLLAFKIINAKIGQGHPWILTFLILWGSWVLAAFSSNFVAIFFAWDLFYQLCSLYEIPKGKYTAYMVAGVCFACIMSGQAFPFHGPVVTMMSAYTGVSGVTVNQLSFTIFMWVTNFLFILGYVILGRIFIRPDVTAISKVNKKLVEQEKLTTYQKLMIGVLCVFLLMVFWPSFMPESWFITTWLSSLGTGGIAAFLLAIIFLCNFKDAPKPQEIMVNGVVWNVIFLVAAVMVVATAMGNEATGISLMIEQVLGPVLGGQPILVFLVLATLLPAIITNFCNNLVVGMIFIPIVYNFCITAGINHAALAVVLCSCCSCAMVTAAGCAPAAMLHGNSEWITPKQAAVCGVLGTVSTWVVSFATLPLAFAMF